MPGVAVSGTEYYRWLKRDRRILRRFICVIGTLCIALLPQFYVGRVLMEDTGDVVNDAMMSILRNPPKNVKNWEALLVTVVKRKALTRRNRHMLSTTGRL